MRKHSIRYTLNVSLFCPQSLNPDLPTLKKGRYEFDREASDTNPQDEA